MSCFNESRNQSDELPWFEYRDPKSTPVWTYKALKTIDDGLKAIINEQKYKRNYEKRK